MGNWGLKPVHVSESDVDSIKMFLHINHVNMRKTTFVTCVVDVRQIPIRLVPTRLLHSYTGATIVGELCAVYGLKVKGKDMQYRG